MSFLRKKADPTSQTVASAAAGANPNILTAPPAQARWTFTGTDGQKRAFSPEHVAALEAAYNRPKGNESVTSVVINGSSYIADFSKMTLRQSTCPG